MHSLKITTFARGWVVCTIAFMLSSCGSEGDVSSSGFTGSAVAVNQGAAWNPTNQASFYSDDQGSWIMPYEWAKALKLANGQSFLSQLTTSYG
jgi:hypothetical protein